MFSARLFALSASCAALLLAAGCTTSPTVSPDTAISRAAAEPVGVETVVRMTVSHVGDTIAKTGGYVISSAPENEKAEGIRLLVTPYAAAEQTTAGIADPKTEFLGREIFVNGIARRVEIEDVDEEGRPNGKIHFITAIVIYSANQIALADSGTVPQPPPTTRSARAKSVDFYSENTGNVALKKYVEALDKRIDRLFSEELFQARHASGFTFAPGRRVRVQVTVLADGRIAADLDEIRSQLRKEPELATVMLRVFTRITEDPVPMPPELLESGKRMIQYETQFGLE